MATSPKSKRMTPVDEDLQKLYNEVWAGFSEENLASLSNEKEIESIYNVYGSDSRGTVTESSQRSSSFYAGPVQAHVPSSSMTIPGSPPSSPRRRLPPTPGGSTSSPAIFQMPQPVPYHDPSMPPPSNPYSYEPYGAYTAQAANGRRLPQAPTPTSPTTNRFTPPVDRYSKPTPPTPTSGSSYQRPTPPVDPTSPTTPPRRAGFQSVNTPDNDSILEPSTPIASSSFQLFTPPAGKYSKPLPDPYDANTTRPPGASAPQLPLQLPDNDYDFSFDAYETMDSYQKRDTLSAPSSGSKVPSRKPSREAFVVPTSPKNDSTPEEGCQDRPAPPSAVPRTDGPYDAGPSSASDMSYDTAPSSARETYYEEASSSADPSRTNGTAWPSEAPSPQRPSFENDPNDPSALHRRTTDVLNTLAGYDVPNPIDNQDYQDDVDDQYWDEEEEEDPSMFINLSLLSHIAVQVRDRIPRAAHVKGSVLHEKAFTGKDVVSAVQGLIQRELAIVHGLSTSDRRVALQVARSLHSQLFFIEVDWESIVLQDGVEDVFTFLGDGDPALADLQEISTGVFTMLTRCYSPSCGDGLSCYAYGCPRKGNLSLSLANNPAAEVVDKRNSWTASIDPVVLASLPQSEINRQSIIHSLVMREVQYVKDLDVVENVFLKPLRGTGSTVMSPMQLEDFIDEVFSNILDLRECNRRLLEVMYVRQREQGLIIQKIGDIFLDAATEFRLAYPAYIGHFPIAEKRLKDEQEHNPALVMFLEQCSRDAAKSGEALRFDLSHFLGRPAEHLQKYPVLLEAILKETAVENHDTEFLTEATKAISSLQTVAQLRTFQAAMCKGPTAKWEWHDMVSESFRKSLPKKEAKRQSILFELIKGEMSYVKDLENIEHLFIRPLRTANPPIIAPDRLDQFISDVFHNYDELLHHHKKLVEGFQEVQREQHPVIISITDVMMDAALNFREAYMEYIPNYPIAAYRIDDEMENNSMFKAFVEQCVRHPDAHRLDMKSFVNRPIPRLLRYELLLKGIMEESEEGHEDHSVIPNVIDLIKSLGKETEPGVTSAKQKVELWRYNSHITFSKQGESVDMDLLDPTRSLVHSGKLLRQPDSGLEWNWSELFVLLFDNYLVMTKIKESKDKDGAVKYTVNRRPIPLDLLTLVNAIDPPTQRSTGLLRGLGQTPMQAAAMTPDSATDSRSVYPITLHHSGRVGGTIILYAESAQIRTDWKNALETAIGVRKAVQESNKVFEVETLSAETFLVPLMATANQGSTWEQNNAFTGKVTCSVPFTTPDKRRLVAVGCQEGVWIGYRHDPNSLRRVLHLKAVTQCAMLEEFGIFLVLADKSLFAYHIEALVPSSPHTAHSSQVPQKLNGTKDVHFFSVGTLHGRTLVAYMKKKGMDSIFRVLEPVGDKINERVKAPVGLGSRLGFRSAKSEWFRIYRDFFLPSESFDLIFLKARIAILCAKGFEIMDLTNFNCVTIPQREDPKFAYLSKRCDACRPMGMFRSADDEFLLCYDEFGVYVDKHGDPVRGGVTIEWEGTAERVAFHHPHVLLFDTRFIEIRNVETGRLAQIIDGTDVRCIWDGRGVSPRVEPKGANAPPDADQQEAKVHAVMTNLTDAPSRTKAIAQQVFELVPTIALPQFTSPRRQQMQQEQYMRQQQELYSAQQRQSQQSQHQMMSDNASMYTARSVGYGYQQQQQQPLQQQYQAPHSAGYAPSVTSMNGPRSGEFGGVSSPVDARPSMTSSWRS